MRKAPWAGGFRGVGKNSLSPWNSGICFVDSAYPNRQVYRHLSAQTVCPRDPRKPPAQGRIAMGAPRRKSVVFSAESSQGRAGNSILANNNKNKHLNHMEVEIPAIRWRCIQLAGRSASSASANHFQNRHFDFYSRWVLPIALRPWRAVFRGKRGKLSERRKNKLFDVWTAWVYLKNNGVPIQKRVFPPPRKTGGQGNKRRGAGFFCYFSCPPRKVEQKTVDAKTTLESSVLVFWILERGYGSMPIRVPAEIHLFPKKQKLDLSVHWPIFRPLNKPK